MGKERPIIDAIVKALREHPEDWRWDGYDLVNSRIGAKVWLANSYYGLTIKAPGFRYGGVTMLSSFFGWATPWRRRVMSAAQAIVTPLIVKEIEKKAALRDEFVRSLEAEYGRSR